MPFFQRTSIHGRRLSITSTGGIGSKSSGSTSHAPDQVAQMWGPGLKSVASASEVEMVNFGITSLTAASATAQNYTILAPVEGVRKDIHIETSASEITLNGATTDIVFQSTFAGVGSSMFLSSALLAGKTVSLLGMSTARWAITGSTANMTIG
jgi:hypothetical protein